LKRSKKLFLIISAIFLAGLIFIALDISRKTRFPGSGKDDRENKLTNSREDSVYSKKELKLPENSIQEIEEKEN